MELKKVLEEEIVEGLITRKNPLFRTNSLHMPVGGGDYNVIVDALMLPEGQDGVEEHEVAHRIFCQQLYFGGFADLFGVPTVGEGSTFTFLKRLAGSSHALIWLLLEIGKGSDISLEGNRLGQIKLRGSERGSKGAAMVLENLGRIEEMYDRAWLRVVPIAELAAIDFAEEVALGSDSWGIKGPGARRGLNKADKLWLVEMVAAELVPYEPRVGDFGSFEDTFRQAWDAYTGIEDTYARRELVRICMTSTWLEDNDKILVSDPLGELITRASLAANEVDRLLASSGLYVGDGISEDYKRGMLWGRQQQDRAKRAWRLVSHVESWALSLVTEPLSSDLRKVRGMVDTLDSLIQRQQGLRGGFTGGIETSGTSMESSSVRDARSSDRGFLGFTWDCTGRRSVRINPVFLLASQPEGDLNIWKGKSRSEWWRLLIALETIRLSLKTGEQAFCPFYGWDIDAYPLQAFCAEDCCIRLLLEEMGGWSQIPLVGEICHLK